MAFWFAAAKVAKKDDMAVAVDLHMFAAAKAAKKKDERRRKSKN
ncbi:hypothetical protein THIOSC13_360004 [uncultured Thiomicrorhabdus sp.]